MVARYPEQSLHIYARIAGLAYIVVIMLGIFSVNFIESNLVQPGASAATVNNILENEFLFRIGIVCEIIMFMLVVLLSVSLYAVLKTVDNNLAMLAMLWRIGEAITGSGVTVLSGLIPLLLLNQESAFAPQHLHALFEIFLSTRTAGLDVVLIFIGMGGTLFCYLFYRSKYIPRILSTWGIFTYFSMLILAITSILVPDLSEATKMVFYAPGGLFELIIGLWLLFKSVNLGSLNTHSSAP